LWFVCNIYVFFDFLDAYKQWWEKVGIMLKSALMKILSIVSNILVGIMLKSALMKILSIVSNILTR